MFVAVCALPSIFLGLWLFLFPESPKFLVECGENDTALDILRGIYHSNTGKSISDYPVSFFAFFSK